MFNPADFDALTARLEEQFLEGPADSNSAEYVSQRRAIATTRRLAESLGMMAAPVRLCQECGAAPVNGTYSRLCEACYAIACEEIRAELAQEQAKEEPSQEEEPQEYILIEPGQEPSGDEALHNMHPDSAKALSYLLKETGDKRRWLPTAEILGSAAIADASDDALEPFA